MNIVFFGNTKYSTISEEALHKKFGLSAVVTLPDRIVGRKKILTANPVKVFAVLNKIPVIEAEKISKEIIEQIKGKSSGSISNYTLNAIRYTLNPDFLVVADYGLILPSELLALPKIAALNIHHSLLPKYRGPSPAPTAILNGDKISGVSVIKMSEELDAGDILSQKEYELKKDETTDSLLSKLNEIGADIIMPVIENYKEIEQNAIKQDTSKATFTKKMTKKDGFINLDNPPSKEKIDQMIRAYFPWPNVWTKLRIKNDELRIKFLPKQKIQVEGKNPVSVKDFFNGYPESKEWIEKIF